MANHSWTYADPAFKSSPYQGPFRCSRCGEVVERMNSSECPISEAPDDATRADLNRKIQVMEAEVNQMKLGTAEAAPDPRPRPLAARRFATEAEGDAYTRGWFEALDTVKRLEATERDPNRWEPKTHPTCTSCGAPATINNIRPGMAWCDRHAAGHAPPDTTGIRLAALEEWQKTVNNRLREDPFCKFNHKNLSARIEQLYAVVSRLQVRVDHLPVLVPHCTVPGCAFQAVEWNKAGAWREEHAEQKGSTLSRPMP